MAKVGDGSVRMKLAELSELKLADINEDVTLVVDVHYMVKPKSTEKVVPLQTYKFDVSSVYTANVDFAGNISKQLNGNSVQTADSGEMRV